MNSQRNEKFELFSQGTHNFQNFGNETLFISDYEIVKKSTSDWLAAKLWLQETTILWNICTFERMNLDQGFHHLLLAITLLPAGCK